MGTEVERSHLTVFELHLRSHEVLISLLVNQVTVKRLVHYLVVTEHSALAGSLIEQIETEVTHFSGEQRLVQVFAALTDDEALEMFSSGGEADANVLVRKR